MMNKSRKLKVFTIASGKGGVGKSSIVVNLAIALSQYGSKVLVVDADFGLANVDVMLGVTSKYNVSHFLSGAKTLPEIIQYGHEGVRFISGGSGVYELLSMAAPQLESFLKGIVKLEEPADYILCDTGAGINEHIIQMVLASSETIIVTTPEPTSILDAYALVKTIVNRSASHKINVIMNKSENRSEAEHVLKGFREVLRRHLEKEVNSLGYVLYDHEVPQSIKRQTPIIITSPNGNTAKDIKAIAARILELPVDERQDNLFARMFARMMGK
jgi:flagellar biosynthesis protein FlhG